MITSAFLSTTLDLLNFADLVLLLVAVMWARSSAERVQCPIRSSVNATTIGSSEPNSASISDGRYVAATVPTCGNYGIISKYYAKIRRLV